MPSLGSPVPGPITKLTNCRLAKDDRLEVSDLWVCSATGTILSSQAAFIDQKTLPDQVIDLGGRIVAPGFIDVQLNGAFGFNFSTPPAEVPGASYAECLAEVNQKLITTGVTSYLPTLMSQKPHLYHQILPHLRRQSSWAADQGAESLGAHVEGPFLNPNKNGMHSVNVIREANSIKDLKDCYGADNVNGCDGIIKMVTVAPERGAMTTLIPHLRQNGIVCSIGHTEATYEEASAAVAAGATMITHLFNAMHPLHHRNPGIFGVLATAETSSKPYFGIIADGIHLHPAAVNIASNMYSEGLILVTDAMHLVGLPDGVYPWMNGDVESNIVKKGSTLHLEGTDTIAGSSISLIECVNNFLAWSGATIPQALRAVSATPAAMLGEKMKGCLTPGADADLVILSEVACSGSQYPQLVVDEVWKLGQRSYRRVGADSPEPTFSLAE